MKDWPASACEAALVDDTSWSDRYPELFQPRPHGWGGVAHEHTVQLTLGLPNDELVVSARLIAVEDGRCLHYHRGMAHPAWW